MHHQCKVFRSLYWLAGEASPRTETVQAPLHYTETEATHCIANRIALRAGQARMGLVAIASATYGGMVSGREYPEVI